MDDAVWDTVDRLVDWIDRNSALSPDTGLLLRLMKLSEEVGEVAEAVLGMDSQHHVTHTRDDVTAELCDVVLTAMVAATSINRDARQVFAGHVQHNQSPPAHDSDLRHQLQVQLLKLCHEVGEVTKTVIGVTGQNPRKGITHSWDDVTTQLCEVIPTAMDALTILTSDAPEALARRLEAVAARSLG